MSPDVENQAIRILVNTIQAILKPGSEHTRRWLRGYGWKPHPHHMTCWLDPKGSQYYHQNCWYLKTAIKAQAHRNIKEVTGNEAGETA